MNNSLVSIIISNYNYECFLQEAINSALNQLYTNVEVVVVDDGSTDNSRKIIDGYGDRVIPVFKDNGGQASAFNAGFSTSCGDIVIFLDADDYLLPHAVERVVATWEPNTVKVHYRLEVIDARGNSLGGVSPPRGTRLDSGDVVPILLKRGFYITPVTSGNAFSRAALDQILPIPEVEFRGHPDGYLYNLVPFYGQIGSIEEALGVYRIHGSNTYRSSLTDVNSEKLRSQVQGYMQEQALIIRKAEELGLGVDRKLDLRNRAHVEMRIASLRLDPRKHPIPSDGRLELVYWGLRDVWGSSELAMTKRFVFSTWFIWVGLMPAPMAKPAIAWLFAPISRPKAVDWMLKILRGMIRILRKSARGVRALMHPRRSVRRVAARVTEIHGALGARGALAYVLKERLLRTFSWVGGSQFLPSTYHLYARESRFPLLCRLGTSDRDVFTQIFVDRDYSCAPWQPGSSVPRFIMDCGANVGYASAYLLERFPNARVLAVEPDPENFKMLCQNLAPYGERARVLCAAVWSRRVGLVVVRGRYRDGREWTTQVRERYEGEETDVWALGVGELLERSGFKQIDLLKVDIEGAESEVFGKNYESWIDKVDTFVIELHDERGREAFFSALKAYGSALRFSQRGDLTVAEQVRYGSMSS